MSTIRRLDMPLLFCLLLLGLLGMAVLYAAVHQGDAGLFQRQAIYWLLGIGVFLGLCFVPLRYIALVCWPLYAVALLALFLVPLVGEVQMGARRWLNLGVFNMQPSEMMKWVLILLLAFVFATRESAQPRALLLALLITAVPVGLVAAQPDLGTALVLLAAAFVMIAAAGLPWRWLLYAGVAALVSMPLVWRSMYGYQKQRVLSFLDPQSDPLGAGYHVIQATIAIGSGGLFGKGYLQGTQARLHFLPEQHTDFIFAVLAEEGGMLAAVALLLLYAFMLIRMLMIAARAHSRFGGLLMLGVSTMFMIYVGVNIGMVSGMLPVVGVPLPFVSYGGSALVSMMAAMGLVMRVAIESQGRIPWQRPANPLA
ncbi:MAG: rod shape-determining protein RodA [Mariprofundaceae bacterium]